MTPRIFLFVALLGLPLVSRPGATLAATVLQPGDAERTVTLSDVAIAGTSVSGTLINKSGSTLHGIHLELRQQFLWTDELHPSADNPGRAVPFELANDLAPHASTAFHFTFPQLPDRTDGRFMSTLEVTGFTEVGP